MKFIITKELPLLGFIFKETQNLNNLYPNYSNWFYDKFIPDVLLGNSNAIIMKNKYEEIIGFSLLKNTIEEKKLRTLRILPKFQKKGYGLYLIDKSLEILNEDKPHCTVAEEMFHEYSRIFINRYHFNLNKVEKGLYRKNKLEYLFN